MTKKSGVMLVCDVCADQQKAAEPKVVLPHHTHQPNPTNSPTNCTDTPSRVYLAAQQLQRPVWQQLQHRRHPCILSCLLNAPDDLVQLPNRTRCILRTLCCRFLVLVITAACLTQCCLKCCCCSGHVHPQAHKQVGQVCKGLGPSAQEVGQWPCWACCWVVLVLLLLVRRFAARCCPERHVCFVLVVFEWCDFRWHVCFLVPTCRLSR